MLVDLFRMTSDTQHANQQPLSTLKERKREACHSSNPIIRKQKYLGVAIGLNPPTQPYKTKY